MKRVQVCLLIAMIAVSAVTLSGCLTLILGDSGGYYTESPTGQAPAAPQPSTDTSQPVKKPPIQTEQSQNTQQEAHYKDGQTQQSAATQPAAEPQNTGTQSVQETVQPEQPQTAVVDRSVNGRDMFNHYISLNTTATLATFRAMGNHRIVYATYDLENMEWINLNPDFDRRKIDLTKFYLHVDKTAAQLDRLSPEAETLLQSAQVRPSQPTQQTQAVQSQPTQSAQPTQSTQSTQQTAVNDAGDIVNSAVNGKTLWGYTVRLKNDNTRAYFYETKSHTIASGFYDLAAQGWRYGREKIYAPSMDLTALYTRVSKSHAQLDVPYEAPAEVVEARTIENNVYLPDWLQLAANKNFNLTIGVGTVGENWTVNLRIGNPNDGRTEIISFPPSGSTRRSATLSTSGYRNGETVPFYYEVIIPGRAQPYVIGVKGGSAAFAFKIKNNGTLPELPYVFKFEDPMPFLSKYLRFQQITAPVTGRNNAVRVEVIEGDVSDWKLSFSFGDAGSRNRKNVNLKLSGSNFLGTYKPAQDAGKEIEYSFRVRIPGPQGGDFFIPGSSPVMVVRDGQRSFSAAELLGMMQIPPIRDLPDTSYDPYNPLYKDWSGNSPKLKMSTAIRSWNFQVYYRKAGAGEDWREAYSTRPEIRKDVSGGYNKDDDIMTNMSAGSTAYYEILLPRSTYWRGDVIEYYFNIYLHDTGQSIDLFKANPMRFKPSDQPHPNDASGAEELFFDKSRGSGSELAVNDFMEMGLGMMYEAHWNRRYRVEFFYRNGSGSYTRQECERSARGSDYKYRFDAEGFRAGSRLEYFYKITASNGDVMYFGSEANPFHLKIVNRYSSSEPGA